MKGSSTSTIKVLNETNNFMILNPSKPSSIENITPIPSRNELGLPINSYEENSKSNSTEIIPFACSCGIELGVFSRIISVLALKEKSTEKIENTFEETIGKYFNKYELKGCCRMRILAPIIALVVNVDMNSKVVDDREELKGSYEWPSYRYLSE